MPKVITTANNMAVSGAAAATNVLTATGANTATWQAPAGAPDARGWGFHMGTTASGVSRIYVAGMGVDPDAAAIGTGTLVTDTLIMLPIPAGHTSWTADLMMMRVTTAGAAGAKFRFALYKNVDDSATPATLYPGALIVESGERDGTVSGLHSIAIGASIVAGRLYWFVMNRNGTATTYRGISSGFQYGVLGREATFGASTAGVGWSFATAYGAMADPCPGTAATATELNPATRATGAIRRT